MASPNIKCFSVEVALQDEEGVADSHLTPAQPFIIRAACANYGDADAQAYRAQIWLDQEHHEVRMKQLAPYETQWIEWYHDPVAAGQHTVVVVCDYNDTIQEGSEHDNRYDYSFEIIEFDRKIDFDIPFEGEEISGSPVGGDRGMEQRGWNHGLIQFFAYDVDEHGVDGLPLQGSFTIKITGNGKENTFEGETDNGTLYFQEAWFPSEDCGVEVVGTVHDTDADRTVSGHGPVVPAEDTMTIMAHRQSWHRTVSAQDERHAEEAFGQEVGVAIEYKIINVSVSGSHQSSEGASHSDGTQYDVYAKGTTLAISGKGDK
jgi:hypothetical protein